MAEIKEFKGLMYDSDIVGDLASVIAPHCHAADEKLIKQLYSSHPFNVVRLEYPVAEEDKSIDKYSKVAKMMEGWLETGILNTEDEPCIYVYEQEYDDRGIIKKVKGITALVKLEEFSESIVIPHESINSKMYDSYKSDRYNLMKTTGAAFSSVLSLYKDDDMKVAELLEINGAPDVEFVDEYGVTQRVWKVSDIKKITEIKEAFAGKQLVIADGHIRYETAMTYYKKMKNEVVEYSGDESFNYVMMNLAPISGNAHQINPVHRLVINRGNFDEEKVITMLSENFEIEKSYVREYDCDKIEQKLFESKNTHSFGLYTGKDYFYILSPKEMLLEDYKTDSGLIHNEVLGKVFGINKENINMYLEYAATIRDGEQAVREGKANYAFYLNPISVRELYGFAECGINMPKRTNCFYPKLMMGIVMNKFDE